MRILFQVLYESETEGPKELATLEGLDTLWKLGQEFDVGALQTELLKDLKRRLTPSTCLEYFPLLSSVDANLGNHILELIAEDAMSVIEAPAFLTLSHSSLLVFLSSSRLRLREEVIFLRLISWGMNQLDGEKKSVRDKDNVENNDEGKKSEEKKQGGQQKGVRTTSSNESYSSNFLASSASFVPPPPAPELPSISALQLALHKQIKHHKSETGFKFKSVEPAKTAWLALDLHNWETVKTMHARWGKER